MNSADLSVLKSIVDWRAQGFQVWLYTVIQTWGSAPRQPGAILALRGDGVVMGSVSGGCIEDDLILRKHEKSTLEDQSADGYAVQLITYGLNGEEAARFGLPCGGTLRLSEEKIEDTTWVSELISRCQNHEIVRRELSLQTGLTKLHSARRGDKVQFDGEQLNTIHGPRWRLLLIGAGQISHYVSAIAHTLDFDVLICDPREEFTHGWEGANVSFISGMPDDAVVAITPDSHTAIVALTHDPRLDDMALLTALKSEAFYVGAMGSIANTQKRRQNLTHLGLSELEISRLHGPIGLQIGSHTPPEIALSLMAEIVSIKNAVRPISESIPGAGRAASSVMRASKEWLQHYS